MPPAYVVITDMDGTLLDEETYQAEPALSQVRRLLDQHIPVIINTSKTRAEIEFWLAQQNLCLPMIVENGSAIYWSRDLPCPDPTAWAQNDRYFYTIWGIDYATLCRHLDHIGRKLGQPLRGFRNMGLDEIMQHTGLSRPEAQLARQREFSEALVIPPVDLKDRLLNTLPKYGLHAVVGNRFLHVLGGAADKGHAVRWLKHRYQAAGSGSPRFIGLGDSPNDRGFLAVVDIAVVLPRKQWRGVDPALRDLNARVAPDYGPRGWAAVIQELVPPSTGS